MFALRPPAPFQTAPDGSQRFRPLGRFGPAYRVDDDALRRRLALAHRLHWLGGLASIGFLFLWVASDGGRDPLMFVAPPLLAYLIVLFVYRMTLRVLLRGVPAMHGEDRAESPARADSGDRS